MILHIMCVFSFLRILGATEESWQGFSRFMMAVRKCDIRSAMRGAGIMRGKMMRKYSKNPTDVMEIVKLIKQFVWWVAYFLTCLLFICLMFIHLFWVSVKTDQCRHRSRTNCALEPSVD